MNREKELATNTAILTIGKICTQFVSFFLLPLYTALLVPEEFGIVDLFNTYIALLLPLFNWQFESGLFRFLVDFRNDKIKQKTIISTVLISNIAQSIIYLTVFMCIQQYIVNRYKIFLAIDVVLSIFLNTLMQIPRGMGKNGTYTVASFISAVSAVGFNVLFIAGLKYGALGMFLGTTSAKVITIVFLIVKERIWNKFSITKFKKEIFKEIFYYSIPLVPNQLAWWLMGVSDRSVISAVLGVAANGIYSVANKFSSVFITFYNIFNLSWTESVALHMGEEDSNDFLADVINSMFRLFSSGCLLIIALMPLVFPILIDIQYAEAFYQIPILMFAVLFQVVVGLYSTIYVALKKTTEIAKTSIWGGLINIITNVLLVRKIGLFAASISTLVAYAVLAIYRYFHVKRYVDIRLEKKIIISTCVMSIIILGTYYSNNILWNILGIIVTILYAFAINEELIKMILELIVKRLKNG